MAKLEVERPVCACGEGFHLDEQPQGGYRLVHGKLSRQVDQSLLQLSVGPDVIMAGCLKLRDECGGGAI